MLTWRCAILQTALALETKAKLFRGFSDPSRLSILETLRDRAMSVGEIVERTGLSQPNTSNHLACLLDCGLVRREQEGRFVYYQISDPRIEVLFHAAEEILTDVAHGVDGCARYDPSGGSS